MLLLMGFRLSKHLLVRIFFCGVLLIPMFWNGLLLGGSTPLVSAVRWLSGFGWAMGLMWMSRHRVLRSVIFKGVIVGTVGALGVVVLQALGFLQLTMDFGLTPRDAAVDKFYFSFWRVPGMEGHVNGSAAVVSLSVPIALGLVSEGRASRKWIVAALAVALAGSALTLNRSSIVVTSTTLIVWILFASDRSISKGWKLSVIIIAIAILIAYGPPGGWQRWQFVENLGQSRNLQVRLETTLTALKMSLQNPLGVGEVYKSYLESRSGYSATHNAFLQLALLAGLPITLWVVWKLSIRAFSLFKEGSIEAFLCLHMLGLFFFEEYFGNTTLIILVAWMTVCPYTKQFLTKYKLIRRAVGASKSKRVPRREVNYGSA
jgi:hypothetical protein